MLGLVAVVTMAAVCGTFIHRVCIGLRLFDITTASTCSLLCGGCGGSAGIGIALVERVIV